MPKICEYRHCSSGSLIILNYCWSNFSMVLITFVVLHWLHEQILYSIFLHREPVQTITSACKKLHYYIDSVIKLWLEIQLVLNLQFIFVLARFFSTRVEPPRISPTSLTHPTFLTWDLGCLTTHMFSKQPQPRVLKMWLLSKAVMWSLT